jgi:hypothetical protein
LINFNKVLKFGFSFHLVFLELFHMYSRQTWFVSETVAKKIQKGATNYKNILFDLQGVMEGPDEFADGLCYGACSLLGHTVGGRAGSISLISSSLGGLLSSLSFDEDYKRVSNGLLDHWKQHLCPNITLGIIQCARKVAVHLGCGT